MKDIRDIDKVRTSIGVRMATKYLILDHSLPGESLEDTIVRLVKTHDRLNREKEELVDLINRNDIIEPNVISASSIERGVDSIEFNGGMIVHYSYNIPSKEALINDEYRMEVQIEKVFQDGLKGTIDIGSVSEKELMNIHFHMVEKIINEHFDKAFKIQDNLNLFDYRYWKRVFFRVGLPESSYLTDVLSRIIEEKSV